MEQRIIPNKALLTTMGEGWGSNGGKTTPACAQSGIFASRP